MEGNEKAVSVRLKGANYQKAGWQKKHDERLGKQPDYVDGNRSHLNSVLIESQTAGELRRLCEERRGAKARKMRSTASVGVSGIITFGKAAQAILEALERPLQDEALLSVAEAVSARLEVDLTGLAVHRDESALHAHFQLPAWRQDGIALSKVMTPAVMSEIQDIAAQAIHAFAPGIERGHKKKTRLANGAKPSEVVNRSVKELHEDLPREIEEKRQELEAIEEKIRKHDARLAKLRQIEALTEKEQKRFETYQRRADAAQMKFEEIKRAIDRLTLVKNQVQNSVEFTQDGQEQFEGAMTLQTEAWDAALALNPETPEIVQSKYEKAAFKDGQKRLFSRDRGQNEFAHCFIRYCFTEVTKFFAKIKNSLALAEYARSVPEPLQQLQNHIDSLKDAVRDTLTQIGVANQQIDLGEYDEKGEPPPVLELVFSRANRKTKELNQDLANAYSMNGPSM